MQQGGRGGAVTLYRANALAARSLGRAATRSIGHRKVAKLAYPAAVLALAGCSVAFAAIPFTTTTVVRGVMELQTTGLGTSVWHVPASRAQATDLALAGEVWMTYELPDGAKTFEINGLCTIPGFVVIPDMTGDPRLGRPVSVTARRVASLAQRAIPVDLQRRRCDA